MFQNGSNYHYHFIIEDLVEKFDGNLLVQEKRLQQQSVPTEKAVKGISKTREEITKTISYRLRSIDNKRFIAGSLSNQIVEFNTKIASVVLNT